MNKKEIEQIIAILQECKEMVYNWGGYASEYFQEKHDLKGQIASIDTNIKEIKEELSLNETNIADYTKERKFERLINKLNISTEYEQLYIYVSYSDHNNKPLFNISFNYMDEENKDLTNVLNGLLKNKDELSDFAKGAGNIIISMPNGTNLDSLEQTNLGLLSENSVIYDNSDGEVIDYLGDKLITILELNKENELLAFENKSMADFLTSLGIDETRLTDIIYHEDRSKCLVIKKVVDMFYKDEQKHWEESGKPDEHIFHSLNYLNKLVEQK